MNPRFHEIYQHRIISRCYYTRLPVIAVARERSTLIPPHPETSSWCLPAFEKNPKYLSCKILLDDKKKI